MQTATEPRAKSGKYLTFALGVEEFGLDVLRVTEIIGPMEITATPQAPSYVRGVISLRSQVIPIVDLRTRLNMTTEGTFPETCIIIVDTHHNQEQFSAGFVADRVCNVLDIPAEQIEPASSFATGVETDFILGVGQIADSVKILLDTDNILDSSRLARLFQVRASIRRTHQPATERASEG